MFVDHRVTATLIHLRHGLPHSVLALLFGVDRSTISRAVGEVRGLLANRGFAVPDRPGIRLRTLTDVLAYAQAEGVVLRPDATEVQVRRGIAGRGTPSRDRGLGDRTAAHGPGATGPPDGQRTRRRPGLGLPGTGARESRAPLSGLLPRPSAGRQRHAQPTGPQRAVRVSAPRGPRRRRCPSTRTAPRHRSASRSADGGGRLPGPLPGSGSTAPPPGRPPRRP